MQIVGISVGPQGKRRGAAYNYRTDAEARPASKVRRSLVCKICLDTPVPCPSVCTDCFNERKHLSKKQRKKIG